MPTPLPHRLEAVVESVLVLSRVTDCCVYGLCAANVVSSFIGIAIKGVFRRSRCGAAGRGMVKIVVAGSTCLGQRTLVAGQRGSGARGTGQQTDIHQEAIRSHLFEWRMVARRGRTEVANAVEAG